MATLSPAKNRPLPHAWRTETIAERPPERNLIGRRNFLQQATLAGAATLAPSLANAGSSDPASDAQLPLINPAKTMPETVTADEIRTLLKLEPNATCGFVRETYKSDLTIAPGGLPAPFADGRPLGSALYFMVTPEAPVKLHRIKNDQLYHYYLGDPIEVLLLRENGDQRACRGRPEPHRRTFGPALHPRQHLPHRAHHRQAPLVPGREHRMAGRGA